MSVCTLLTIFAEDKQHSAICKQAYIALVCIIFAAENKERNNNMDKFTEIINSEQPTLVDFFATWCGPCKMMHHVLEQLKEELGDKIRILKLDVDKNEALSQQYRIQSVPTLMLFKKGEVVWRQSGAMRINDLRATLDPML